MTPRPSRRGFLAYQSDQYAGLLAYFFNIRPWEHHLLTVRQFQALAAEADRMAKEGIRRG